MSDQPTTTTTDQPDKLDMGLTADAEVRHTNSQLPTHDETIRINALSLAISAVPRLVDTDSGNLIETAARFEAWIRGEATS